MKYGVLLKPVNEMLPSLSTSVRNILARAGINTIGQLLDRSSKELLKLRGMGPKSFSELEEAIKRFELPGLADARAVVEVPEMMRLLKEAADELYAVGCGKDPAHGLELSEDIAAFLLRLEGEGNAA